MGWSMHGDYDAAWEKASEAARAREDSIKAPSRIPKDQIWQDGEWGRWTEIEQTLEAQRRDALTHRDQKILGQLKEVIQKALYACGWSGSIAGRC